jgi:hypothetical protein
MLTAFFSSFYPAVQTKKKLQKTKPNRIKANTLTHFQHGKPIKLNRVKL